MLFNVVVIIYRVYADFLIAKFNSNVSKFIHAVPVSEALFPSLTYAAISDYKSCIIRNDHDHSRTACSTINLLTEIQIAIYNIYLNYDLSVVF